MIVDRTETTGTLALASVAQALIAVGLAFAEPVWLVVALSFLLGSAAAIASPAVFAIVPTAVDEEDLTEANATMETVRYIGMVAGPLIAGGLAGALGADRGTRAALLLDAITFLVITSAAASLKVRRLPEAMPEGGREKHEARRGFAFIRRDRVLLIAVAAVATTVLFATMDNVAEVFFANDPDLLNAGNWGYGALAAVWLLGMVLGAALVARRLSQERLAPAVLLSSLTGGVAVAIAALFPNIVLALAMFAIGGMANGVSGVSMRSLIHHRVPDQLRGRVFAAYFGVAFAGQLAATALGGVLIAVLPSSQDVLLIGGVGGAVVGLVGMAWFAALPSEARAPVVVHLPETEPVEGRMVVVRDITPSDDHADRSPWRCFPRSSRRPEVAGIVRGGGAMPDPLNLPERKDADGEWHQVVRDVCYWCGCHYLHAEDDRDLVWEPGKEREKACSDDECECHTAPLVGQHRD